MIAENTQRTKDGKLEAFNIGEMRSGKRIKSMSRNTSIE